MQGQRIDSFEYLAQSSGEQQIQFEVARYNSGSYICRLITQEGSASVRFQLIK